MDLLFSAHVRAFLNRTWRFSRWRALLWIVAAHAAVLAVAIWQGARLLQFDFEPAFFAIVVQTAAVGLMGGFLGGRQELYSNRFLGFLMVATDEPQRLLRSYVAWSIIGRTWAALFWATLYAVSMRTTPWYQALPILFAGGAITGVLGHLAGMQVLMFCARVSRRLLEFIWTLLFMVQLGIIGFVGYWLIRGPTSEQIAAFSDALRTWLALPLGVIALAGLTAGATLLISSSAAGLRYRASWLALREGDGTDGERRSRWPVLVGGTIGAIQAKEWLQAARNRLTFMRAIAWLVVLVIIAACGSLAAELREPIRIALAMGIGLGISLFTVGEILAASFRAEGPQFALFVLAGVGPMRLLTGKFLAGLPLALGAALTGWIAALAMGMTPALQGKIVVAQMLIGLGLGAIVTGFAACGTRLVDAQPSAESDALGAVMEQLPRGIAAWAGMLCAAAYGSYAVFMSHDLASPFRSPWLALPPIIALAIGRARLRRVLTPSAATLPFM